MANLKSQIAGIDRAHGESREKVRAYLKAIEKIKASDVWDKMPWWDRAALFTSPVPVLGALIGTAADSYNMYKDPSAFNAAMIGTNLVPGAKLAAAYAKVAKQGKGLFSPEGIKQASETLQAPAKETINKALHEFPNYLPGFYGGGIPGKAYGMFAGGVTAGKNIIRSHYSKTDQGMWKQHGVSRTDMDVGKRYSEMLQGKYNPNIVRRGLDELEMWVMGEKQFFKTKPVKGMKKADYPKDLKSFNPLRYKKADISKDAQKKIMGQINQSRLFNEQYGIQSDFYKILNGMDQIAYSKLGAKEYDTLMEGATGLNKTDLETVFKHMGMKEIQNINPKKDYRMALRRPNTAASGNLERVLSGLPKVFGGTNINGLKKIFGGVYKGRKDGWDLSNSKVFKTDKEFLDALLEAKVRVRNPEEVLKGRPAIVTGSLVSDAYELGGVNYMTAIRKDGRLTSFMNDENDVLFIKAPLASRMLSISTPIVYDLLGAGRKSGTEASKTSLKESSAKIQAEVAEIMSKMPGVDNALKVPSPNTTIAQWKTIQALRGLKVTDPKAISEAKLTVGTNIAKAGNRLVKPIERNTEVEESNNQPYYNFFEEGRR